MEDIKKHPWFKEHKIVWLEYKKNVMDITVEPEKMPDRLYDPNGNLINLD